MAWIPEKMICADSAARDEVATSRSTSTQAATAGVRAGSRRCALNYFTRSAAACSQTAVEMAHVLASKAAGRGADGAGVARALEKDAANPFCRALFTHALRTVWSRRLPSRSRLHPGW